jgi:hypothetical protein
MNKKELPMPLPLPVKNDSWPKCCLIMVRGMDPLRFRECVVASACIFRRWHEPVSTTMCRTLIHVQLGRTNGRVAVSVRFTAEPNLLDFDLSFSSSHYLLAVELSSSLPTTEKTERGGGTATTKTPRPFKPHKAERYQKNI